ncbi:MAG TPA: tetratricopeptide repeat protein [Thermoguttaceae bacterium]
MTSKNFYEAQEIVGQHEIGTPLLLSGQGNIADRIEISGKLSARIQALSRITVGLAYYSVRRFDRALTILQSTETVEGWEDSEGKQVLYLLIGNAAGKLSDFGVAAAYYERSRKLDPDYARAYIGLANVDRSLALKLFEQTQNPADIDSDLIDQAVRTYQQAIKAAHQSSLSDVSTKVHFGLGECYLLRTYSGKEQSFDAAVGEFRAVIGEYADGANPRVRELAAESHARLGLIYDLSGHTDQAIKEYQMAATLLYDNPDRQLEYQQRAQKLQS